MSLLPEGICCCLQTCHFVVMFMLMNNVCVQSFNFIQAIYYIVCASYDHIYVSIDVLPKAVCCCLQELHCLQKFNMPMRIFI